MKRIFPTSFYNLMTLVGVAIASVSFGLILFLVVLELLGEQQKPYMGIITFVILPTFLFVGVALIIGGIMRQHRRESAGTAKELRLPEINLNNPRHRTAFFFFSFGGLMLLIFSAFGSFKAYEYTDSDNFCGEICHSVMNPEFTAYQYSPHARVGCVKCHIGAGADYFVRSKLAGSYQLYAVTFNKYPRPIPTPIENLRPAQETCEQCHWPNHFFSQKQIVNSYYLSDKQNTNWTLNLLMKIGGGNPEAGPTSGIHWHMNIANEVTYAAIDRARDTIVWIRTRTHDGIETVYRRADLEVPENVLSSLPTRHMDCIDCHNRPSHIYRPPITSVNHLLKLKWIDPTLPYAKSIAVRSLEYPYTSKTIALDSIKLVIENFYQNEYPDIARSKREAVTRMIKELQTVYSRNYFPEMKVGWRQYPDHIGHLTTLGCFRCHDGKHKSEDGKVLSKDCNLCHTILAQQFEKDRLRISLGGIEYRHPVDIGDAWKEMNCSDCHGVH